MQDMRTLRALAALLGYPDPQLIEALPEIAGVLAQSRLPPHLFPVRAGPSPVPRASISLHEKPEMGEQALSA